jgi:3-oxoacyl-[acyl-carrier protein] reductase
MDLGLKNKRVLVTGASRGIGAAIAERLLLEGADVMIVSRGSDSLFLNERLLKKRFGTSKVIAEVCDCTNFDALLLLKEKVMKRWTNLDVVVANIGDGRSVADPLPEAIQWDRTWDVNFNSALFTARAFMTMLQASRGSLLFVSSIVAKEALGAPVDYSTSKAAITALAKNVARKVAKDMRVNVIAPGNVYFEGGSWEEKLKNNPKLVKETIKQTVPMGRFGKPEEIANAAVFLCSERASFITGSVMVVDGGQTASIF